jgi:two-component system, OmpR family, response regulator
LRILVVDDNKDITEAISFYCQSEDISYKVINQGKKAQDIIQHEKFDLILLDLAMPEFSGLDVIKWLNEEGILESNKVVIFTASSDRIVLDKIKGMVLRKYSKNHFH